MILYHLSPRRFEVIRAEKDATGKGRIWLCDIKRILWAREHLAKHHGQEMRYCYKVSVKRELLKKLRAGIFRAFNDIVPIERTKIERSESEYEREWFGNGQ